MKTQGSHILNRTPVNVTDQRKTIIFTLFNLLLSSEFGLSVA